MVMTYGDIDKSKERRNHINLIVKNLTEVIEVAPWEDLHLIGEDDREELGKLVIEALETAQKLKGDR